MNITNGNTFIQKWIKKVPEIESSLEEVAYVPPVKDIDLPDNIGFDSADIVQTALNDFNFIKIPKGHYLFGKSVKVPSNKTIEMDEGTIIEIKSGASCYAFVNEDLENGNENITILGGKILGNSSSQTRRFAEALEESYYGFGMLFHKVKNLHLGNIHVEETNSYGICYVNCNIVHIHDIFIWQPTGSGTNHDGVSGGGSNVLIENIRGYSADDLVTCCAYGGQIGNNQLLFPNDEDIFNITIRNIEAIPRDSRYAYKAVALYNKDGRTISDVVIENIKGKTEQASILIYTAETGHYKNLTINKVKCKVATRGRTPIEFYNVKCDIVSISELQRYEDLLNSSEIYVYGDSIIDAMNLSDSEIEFKSSVDSATFLYDTATIKKLHFNNIIFINELANRYTKLYDKNSDNDFVTSIKATNISLTNIDYNNSPIVLTKGFASLNMIDYPIDKDMLTPNNFDTVLDKWLGIVSYYNGVWRKLTFPQACKLSLTNNAQLTTSMSKIPFDKKAFDTSKLFDLTNTRISIINTGVYNISATLAFENVQTNTKITCAVFVNGLLKSYLFSNTNSIAQSCLYNGNTTLNLQTGDYVEIYASSTNNTVCISQDNQTFVSINSI